MSFEADGELSITVPQRELDAVKQQVQEAVGTTEVGLTDGGTMSAQTARGSGRGRRRARRSFRMEEERTSYLEESVTYLEEIEDHLAEGMDGGGGVVDDMLGAVVETGGDAAVEGGGMLADLGIETLGTTLGSTVSSAVSNAISSSSVSVSKPSWIPLKVEDPEPIDVENPPTAGFESTPGPVGFEELPGPVGFADLPGPVGFGDLPGPVGFESLPGPISVDDPSPLEVEDVEPIEVEVGVTTSSTQIQTGDTASSGSKPKESGPIAERMASGFDFITPFSEIRTAEEGGPGQTPGDWSKERLREGLNFFPGVNISSESGSGSSTSGPATTQPITVNVDLDNRNRITVETTTDEVVDEVMAEVEDEYGDAIDDLEADLEDALAEIDALRDSFSGRR